MPTAAPGHRAVGPRCGNGARGGLGGQSNGALLDLAAREFDVPITMDRGMEFQQDLGRRDLCVVVLAAPSNRLDALAPLVPDILAALQAVRPGDVVRIGA